MTGHEQRNVTVDAPGYYRITVQGSLDPTWSDRLSSMSIEQDVAADGPRTLLKGMLVDQAALHGVLDALHTLSLPILSVELVES